MSYTLTNTVFYVYYLSVKLEKKKKGVGFFSLEHYSLKELSPTSDENLEDLKPATAKVTFAWGRCVNVLLRKLRDQTPTFLSDGSFPSRDK